MKLKYSAKMNPSTLNVLNNALKKMDSHYGVVLVHWNEATAEQKIAFIQHSPALKRIIDWAAQWKVE
jgi:hypothetical protein